MDETIFLSPPIPREKQLCEAPGILPNSWLFHKTFTRDAKGPLEFPLNSAIENPAPNVRQILYKELGTLILDEISPHLYLFAKKSSLHIDALHVQLIKGRKIVITEDPQLHLIWFYDTIYLKPIPPYLLSHGFWAKHPCSLKSQNEMSFGAIETETAVEGQSFQKSLFTSALGFLRTYGCLIRYQSDFELAKEYRLIPSHCCWTSYAHFIAHCCHPAYSDFGLARRYAYGQIRFNRLNYAVRILQPKNCPSRWYYHRTHWNGRSYIGQFFGPILFVFASISVLLSGFQVVLSVPGYSNTTVSTAAQIVSQSFIIAVGIMWIVVLGGIAGMLTSQILFALRSE